jgi:ribulose-phosphate 3-epimerase
MHTPILAPSILAGNYACLNDSLKCIESSCAQWLHLDIMDGHFVPNISFGPDVVKALRAHSKLFFDVHLMLDKPQGFIKPFIEAGAQSITVHIEPDYPIEDTIQHIKKAGLKVGLALNPDTPLEGLYPFLERIDLVLVMTVQAGFGGQAFREDMLSKIEILQEKRLKDNLNYRIQVDGGINEATGLLCKQAGADTFVAGTAFFKAQHPPSFFKNVIEG